MQASARDHDDHGKVAMTAKSIAIFSSRPIRDCLRKVNLSIGTAVLIVGTVLGASTLAARAQDLEAKAEAPHLTVTAQGAVSIVPDMVVVTAGVRIEAATAEDALKQNAKRAGDVIAALSAAGVDKRDITTSRLSVQPVFNTRRSDEPPRIVGYQAGTFVTVRMRGTERAGAAIDRMVAAGANAIDDISFDVSDRDQRLDEARKLAVEAATRRARLLAEAAGVRLGAVTAITEGVVGGEPPMPRMRVQGLAGASMPVEPGAQELRAEVTVTWQIGPAR